MLRIAHLFEHPQHTGEVARWIHGEFWRESNVHTPESLERLLKLATDPCAIPLSLLALAEGMPVGTVNLVENDDETRAHLRPWLAALFVVPDRRRLGIGSMLVKHLQQCAARLEIAEVYLGTDKPGFYARLGATIHEQVNKDFAIMRLRCVAE